MSLVLLFTTALREIAAHKFRSMLSMLGIVLGVSSLVATMAMSAGIAKGMRAVMEQIGGLEFVSVVEKEISLRDADVENLSPGRTLADAYALKDNIANIVHVAPELRFNVTATVGARAEQLRLTGIWPDMFMTGRHVMAAGRFISEMDIERSARVAVIGATASRTLFPGVSPEGIVGRTINFNDSPFTVVGVLTLYETDADRIRRERTARQNTARRNTTPSDSRPSNMRDPLTFKNRSLFIPFSTMFYEFRSGEFPHDTPDTVRVHPINFSIGDLSKFRATLEQARAELLVTHRGVEDFDFDTREEWFTNLETSVASTRMSGGLIALVSLIVGGVGIMNIMLASITQRIREIGIRMAVGARQRDIFLQILAESVSISFLGALVGIATGIGLLDIITRVSPQDNAPIVEPFSFVVAIGFGVFAGIVSGLYPALKASRLDPISALRFD